MEECLYDFLADRMGIQPAFAEAVLKILSWIGGMGVSARISQVLWIKMYSSFKSNRSSALDAFLVNLNSDDAKYESREYTTRSGDGKATTHNQCILTAPKIMVTFSEDASGTSVKEIAIDGANPLLNVLNSREQDVAKRAAMTRRSEIIERDRCIANDDAAVKMAIHKTK